jgi:hypothetical protein
MAKMARTRTFEHLLIQKQNAGESFGAQLAFALRRFELDPSNREWAGALLSLIPNSAVQLDAWNSDNFCSAQCQTESDADVESICKLRFRFSRDMAKAVLLVPKKMSVYVEFAPETLNPEEDYAVQMKAVCLGNHKGFAQAVAGLPTRDRDWFIGHILNPKGCRVLAFPEAD